MKLVQFLLLTSILLCCTITKRVHLPGYHVEWKNKSQSATQEKTKKENNYFTLDENQDCPKRKDLVKSSHEEGESINSIYQNSTNSLHGDRLKKESIKTGIQTRINGLKENFKKEKIKILKPITPYIEDTDYLKKIGLILIAIGVFILLSILLSQVGENINLGDGGGGVGGCIATIVVFLIYLIIAGIGWLLVWAFGINASILIGLSFILIGLILVGIQFIIQKRRQRFD